jgi:hypothetical protein
MCAHRARTLSTRAACTHHPAHLHCARNNQCTRHLGPRTLSARRCAHLRTPVALYWTARVNADLSDQRKRNLALTLAAGLACDRTETTTLKPIALTQPGLALALAAPSPNPNPSLA